MRERLRLFVNIIVVLAIVQSPLANACVELSSTSSMSFLWYPVHPDLTLSSHAKVEVDEEVYMVMDSIQKHGSLGGLSRLANEAPKYSFVRFEYEIPSEIVKSLQTEIIAKTRTGTCSMGACHMLREAGVVNVPPIIEVYPYLTALYLLTLNLLNVTNAKISIHNRKGTGIGLVMMPLTLPPELLGGTLIGGTSYVIRAIGNTVEATQKIRRFLKNLGLKRDQVGKGELPDSIQGSESTQGSESIQE